MSKTTPRSRTLALAAAFVVVLGAFGIYAIRDGDPAPGPAPSPTLTTQPPVMPARIAVVGDSISNGYGAANGYPELMAAQFDAQVVFDATEDGATVAGFLPGGPHDLDLAGFAAARPDLTIVALGTNEHLGKTATPQLYAGQLGALVDRVCTTTDAPVLLVHLYGVDADALHARYPAAVPVGPRPSWAAYGAAMEQAAAGRGVGYLDLGGATVSIGPDGAHPDDAGQATLARLVTAGIERASTCGGAR